MARQHYFEVHKNKSPRKLRKRKLNPIAAKLAISAAMSALQISSIQSQPIYSKDSKLKGKVLVSVAIDGANNLLKTMRDDRLQKFKETGKYGKGTIYNSSKSDAQIKEIKRVLLETAS